ncbi:MAG: 3-isopropylmalate dehydratase small subunit [Treponema sp.]|jgi:3-isopropylmalate dehydratase small subunit|nr:3-isopropylmalate dehydratase small subunit [Treponema sp.]
MNSIKGKVLILGDNIDTDQILPGYAMAEPFNQLGKFAMAGCPELDFAHRAQGGDILVAGCNFGCGSSREQAPIALKMAGVSLVVAVNFARIFRRNAINIGLPVYVADIVKLVHNGELIEVDMVNGMIHWAGKTIKTPPLSPGVLKTLDYGGLIPQVRAELSQESKK